MGVHESWYDDEQTVIMYTFAGTWTWEEYEVARKNVRILLDSVDKPIDQIYDFSDASLSPPKNVVSRFWSVAVTSHANTSGLIIVVGPNRLTEMLTNTVGKVISLAKPGFDISYITDKTLLDEHLQERRKVHRD